MSLLFFCKINDEIIGPLSESKLIDLAEEGILKPQDLIRSSNSQIWVKANKFSSLNFDEHPKPKHTENGDNIRDKIRLIDEPKIDNYFFISLLSKIYFACGSILALISLILILIDIYAIFIIFFAHAQGNSKNNEDLIIFLLFVTTFVFLGSSITSFAFGQLLKLIIYSSKNLHDIKNYISAQKT